MCVPEIFRELSVVGNLRSEIRNSFERLFTKQFTITQHKNKDKVDIVF